MQACSGRRAAARRDGSIAAKMQSNQLVKKTGLLHACRGNTVVGPVGGPTRFRKFKDEPGGPAPPYLGPPLRPLGEVEMRSPSENGSSKTAAGADSSSMHELTNALIKEGKSPRKLESPHKLAESPCPSCSTARVAAMLLLVEMIGPRCTNESDCQGACCTARSEEGC
jgi:hypothetical protein